MQTNAEELRGNLERDVIVRVLTLYPPPSASTTDGKIQSWTTNTCCAPSAPTTAAKLSSSQQLVFSSDPRSSKGHVNRPELNQESKVAPTFEGDGRESTEKKEAKHDVDIRYTYKLDMGNEEVHNLKLFAAKQVSVTDRGAEHVSNPGKGQVQGGVLYLTLKDESSALLIQSFVLLLRANRKTHHHQTGPGTREKATAQQETTLDTSRPV